MVFFFFYLIPRKVLTNENLLPRNIVCTTRPQTMEDLITVGSTLHHSG